MKIYLLFISICFYSFLNAQDYQLLVRLKTSKNQIRAAIETGNPELAQEIKEKTKKENLEIVKGFRSNWGRNVYFFYSSDYQKVKKGEFEDIFLTDELESDKTIEPNLDVFYISYWGNSPNLNMNVITLLNSDFEETEIWIRTFGITPQLMNRIGPQITRFKEKVDLKLPKYIAKQKRK